MPDVQTGLPRPAAEPQVGLHPPFSLSLPGPSERHQNSLLRLFRQRGISQSGQFPGGEGGGVPNRCASLLDSHA